MPWLFSYDGYTRCATFCQLALDILSSHDNTHPMTITLQEQTLLASEPQSRRFAVLHLTFDDVRAMPAHLDVFEHSVEGAARELLAWAHAKLLPVDIHEHTRDDGTRVIVYVCRFDGGAIKVFK